ncbi:hypothetical protein [Myxococcus sp. CA039A]|uniref:hypothetical protein n=1 Tax=Myxococcus sp. CA039A TaxID=2741737 RepID=UPI00157AB003|nr:hypothetical protein [Myxococcus sp. CA039A]NTX57663.1 hypothetical protein [Myxococcus sp. CA039A]
MAGNRLTVDVALVGPREGETCSLAGFDFKNGVAEVPRHAATALHILGKYHNAFQVDSREYEEAQANWRKTKARAESVPVDPKLVSALEDARSELENRLAAARSVLEEEQAEAERLRAELRAEREAKKAAEAKLADAWKSSPPMPTTEEPPAPKGKAKAKAE